MPSLPALLDITDDLERARETADADIDDDVDQLRDRLDAAAERTRANREGVVDEMDNELLRLEERTDGEAERRFRAARSRLQLYREAEDDRADRPFAVLASTLRESGGGELEAHQEVGFAATVLNEKAPRDLRLDVDFFDADVDAAGTVRGPTVSLDADEQRTVEFEVEVPGDAAYYRIAPTETAG